MQALLDFTLSSGQQQSSLLSDLVTGEFYFQSDMLKLPQCSGGWQREDWVLELRFSMGGWDEF